MHQTDPTLVQPTLILIRGLPGSGKSHLAEALAQSLGKDTVLILDPDSIDRASKEYLVFSDTLSQEGVDSVYHPHRWSRERGFQAIRTHKTIIWNQAFTNLGGFNRTIDSLRAYASEHGTTLPVLVVEVEVRHDIAKQRVANRVARGGHDVPEEAFARFIREYASFADQGYNLVTVNGEDDVATSVSVIVKALHKLKD